VLLSRHPFAFEPRFRPFSMQRGIAESDRFAQKGALFAAMRRAEDGRPFDLVSTHLHAGPGRIARRARAAQLAELGELVDDTRARDPRRPLVLTGDLNVEAERDGAPTEEYRAMRSALGLSDAWRARHPDIERAPGLTLDTSRNLLAERFSPHDFRGRLDYTLYTPETLSCLEAHVRDAPDEGADLSDHYALETTLAWRHER
jgi:endonuclease/exonuclease/phosphatase family metal-dependent hydrolase